MKIILAPMEGVIEHHMRSILTGMGGYDSCVTEFLRVTDQVLPDRVFKRLLPELEQASKTPSGTPVKLQLLGGDSEIMAANAIKGVRLGAPAIDINFGCPSKFVNRKMGGSVLLREPDRVYSIVSAVRNALKPEIPVTAKMRLGYEDESLTLENALAIESAGASEVVVHARTKADGYKHPARWESLAVVREAIHIPLIANGDIVTLEDYHRCVEISGCEDVMLGRGALINPSLARQIKSGSRETESGLMDWVEITKLILEYSQKIEAHQPQKYTVMRLKQWLSMLQRQHAPARQVFSVIRRMKSLNEIRDTLGQASKLIA